MSRPADRATIERERAWAPAPGSQTAAANERPTVTTVPPNSGIRNSATRRASSRWVVTSEFLHEGYRYRIMRRPLSVGVSLTAREGEVLSHAAVGLGNKQIAKILGIAASTVGVLLFRAAAKFGVKTREQLLAAHERANTTEPLHAIYESERK